MSFIKYGFKQNTRAVSSTWFHCCHVLVECNEVDSSKRFSSRASVHELYSCLCSNKISKTQTNNFAQLINIIINSVNA
jgi:hypothetical protein